MGQETNDKEIAKLQIRATAGKKNAGAAVQRQLRQYRHRLSQKGQ
jgi:hypothetical protein